MLPVALGLAMKLSSPSAAAGGTPATGLDVSSMTPAAVIAADKAIPLGLLINELVTNSAKHAYPDGAGEIRVYGERRGTDLHVEVSDRGIGLPKDFDIDQPRASLGFKVINSLLAQLDGRIAVASTTPKGVTVQLDVPLDGSAA